MREIISAFNDWQQDDINRLKKLNKRNKNKEILKWIIISILLLSLISIL